MAAATIVCGSQNRRFGAINRIGLSFNELEMCGQIIGVYKIINYSGGNR